MINLLNCTNKEFESIVNENNVVCFCAGKELLHICDKFPYIVDKIVCIADNNKKNQSITIRGKKIQIVSFEDVKDKCANYIGVISTMDYIPNIVEQLDGSCDFDEVRIYIPFLLKEDSSKTIKLNYNKSVIPKKIHYCWFGKSKIPETFVKNINSWKKKCPEYEIIEWNESNYDISKNNYMREAYEAKKWGFVPDFTRLDIINEHGGIYLDTDVEILKSYDELLGFNAFCGFENKNYVALGLGFGSIPNNPLLVEMMELYKDIKFRNPDGTLNMIASPIYQTDVLRKHGLKCNGEFQIVDDCAIFPQEYFAPINYLGLGTPTPQSFSIHYYAATWLDDSMQKQKNKMLEIVEYLKNRMVDAI